MSEVKTNEELLKGFLGYTGRTSRGRAKSLDWDDEVDVWLHCHTAPIRTWGRWVPRISTFRSDDGAEEVKLSSTRVVSLEEEETNERQFFRNRITGEREVPPQRDPIDILIEKVRGMVSKGELSYSQELFRWETGDAIHVLHAAGIWGWKTGRELTEAQKKEMMKVGVTGANSWKEDLTPRMRWAFVVVNDKKPEDGVQVSVESKSLGNKVRELIAKAIKSDGPTRGNPVVTPYCIRWEHHDDKSLPFDEQYEATQIRSIDLRPEVERMIRSAETLPDLAYLTEKPNLLELRANLEGHCLVKLPWEEIFKPATAYYKKNGIQPNGQAAANDNGSTEEPANDNGKVHLPLVEQPLTDLAASAQSLIDEWKPKQTGVSWK